VEGSQHRWSHLYRSNWFVVCFISGWFLHSYTTVPVLHRTTIHNNVLKAKLPQENLEVIKYFNQQQITAATILKQDKYETPTVVHCDYRTPQGISYRLDTNDLSSFRPITCPCIEAYGMKLHWKIPSSQVPMRCVVEFCPAPCWSQVCQCSLGHNTIEFIMVDLKAKPSQTFSRSCLNDKFVERLCLLFESCYNKHMNTKQFRFWVEYEKGSPATLIIFMGKIPTAFDLQGYNSNLMSLWLDQQITHSQN